MTKNTVRTLPVRILLYQKGDCSMLADFLEQSKYIVDTAATDDVMAKIRGYDYDMCILDLYDGGNDKISDLEPLRLLRKSDKSVPVIMLTDSVAYSVMFRAFDAGADDFVQKPYSIGELLRRISAILTRCGIRERAVEREYHIGKYTFYTETNELRIGDERSTLTPRAGSLLRMLCVYMGEPLPRRVVVRAVFPDLGGLNENSLTTHVSILRNELSSDSRILIERTSEGYILLTRRKATKE